MPCMFMSFERYMIVLMYTCLLEILFLSNIMITTVIHKVHYFDNLCPV